MIPSMSCCGLCVCISLYLRIPIPQRSQMDTNRILWMYRCRLVYKPYGCFQKKGYPKIIHVYSGFPL